jgi:hypothetical protein
MYEFLVFILFFSFEILIFSPLMSLRTPESKVTLSNLFEFTSDPENVFGLLRLVYIFKFIEQDLRPWVQANKVFMLHFSSMDALLRIINNNCWIGDKCTPFLLSKEDALKELPKSKLLQGLNSDSWGLLLSVSKDEDQKSCEDASSSESSTSHNYITFCKYKFPRSVSKNTPTKGV